MAAFQLFAEQPNTTIAHSLLQVNIKKSVIADPCTIEDVVYLLSPSYSGSSLAALAGQAPLG